ncbi:hypothetical protein TL18_05010 [Methanobrevibacter sp. YE315]|uniref:thioredoxin family protein n=1 Tax=Methanobrevibacter sp. YE315 TaxID=1609968 RepID=UPI000764F18D|nr:thioredoxin family protein [Methanobrevibacter sp. YE315]AMD17435.1 hypothetical protein TL18_05010 [Methanobrevibacter sp. YE315]
MKRNFLILMAIFVVLTVSSAVYSVDFENTTIPGLNITTDIDSAFNVAQSQNKTVVIIFDQESCVYCDMLKKDVLSNSDVQKELNENFVVVLVDINKNPNIAAEYNVFGTPIIQFIDSDGKLINKIEGYVDSDEFLQSIKEI